MPFLQRRTFRCSITSYRQQRLLRSLRLDDANSAGDHVERRSSRTAQRLHERHLARKLRTRASNTGPNCAARVVLPTPNNSESMRDSDYHRELVGTGRDWGGRPCRT